MPIAPMIAPAGGAGRKRPGDVREVPNGIFRAPSTGCRRNAPPEDLPPTSTMYDDIDPWERDGTPERLRHELYVAIRDRPVGGYRGPKMAATGA